MLAPTLGRLMEAKPSDVAGFVAEDLKAHPVTLAGPLIAATMGWGMARMAGTIRAMNCIASPPLPEIAHVQDASPFGD